ncbi:hypothetical protein FISHEDRAFT_75161 [Fistulina hepatica ATCC 64428]|uniref:Uncharacterized protein n=1 Tax=Fistulina hepatica ATCC 64428 TaxID=1128425 RepID=A0A0D7A846_9AGAR|nr:hypothetical protein FISHEDRAFT_75161 [Fistulina hepatica ATCC 64428]
MTSTNVRGRTLRARSAESAESEPVQFLPEKKRCPRPRKDSHPISEATAEPATMSAQDPVTEAREALRISTSLSTAADFVTLSPSGTTAEGPQGDKDLASPTTPRKLAGWSPRTEEEPHVPGGGSSEDDVPTPLYSTMSPECSPQGEERGTASDDSLLQVLDVLLRRLGLPPTANRQQPTRNQAVTPTFHSQ